MHELCVATVSESEVWWQWLLHTCCPAHSRGLSCGHCREPVSRCTDQPGREREKARGGEGEGERGRGKEGKRGRGRRREGEREGGKEGEREKERGGEGRRERGREGEQEEGNC